MVNHSCSCGLFPHLGIWQTRPDLEHMHDRIHTPEKCIRYFPPPVRKQKEPTSEEIEDQDEEQGS